MGLKWVNKPLIINLKYKKFEALFIIPFHFYCEITLFFAVFRLSKKGVMFRFFSIIVFLSSAWLFFTMPNNENSELNFFKTVTTAAASISYLCVITMWLQMFFSKWFVTLTLNHKIWNYGRISNQRHSLTYKSVALTVVHIGLCSFSTSKLFFTL